MLYILAEPCFLDVVLCHPLRLAVCLLLVDSLALSVVCVCVRVRACLLACACAHTHVLDLPFAQLCHIFFLLTVLWTVVRVTEHIVKGLQPCIAPSYSSRKLKYCAPRSVMTR